jgi:hypothetical protein
MIMVIVPWYHGYETLFSVANRLNQVAEINALSGCTPCRERASGRGTPAKTVPKMSRFHVYPCVTDTTNVLCSASTV